MAAIRLSRYTVESLTQYCTSLLQYQNNQFNNFRNKMDWINYAYARFTQAQAANDKTGMDTFGSINCANGLNEVVNPIVISNCQSMVAYWSEVFLSGYPIFPVVSDPAGKDNAEALEGIIQDHITLSASDAEMQLSFHDAARFNLGILETQWGRILTYNPNTDLTDYTIDNRIKLDYKHINKVKRWDPYNSFWDITCAPAKVAEAGEFVGHSEVINRVMLKDYLNYLSNEEKLFSTDVVDTALESSFADEYYHNPPDLDQFLQGESTNKTTNWDAFIGLIKTQQNSKIPANSTNTYLLTRIYARLIPKDHGLQVPNKSHVHIFMLEFINGKVLINVEKINTPHGKFPAVIFPAIEDGLELQSQSFAHMTVPIQEATTRLFNAKFQMANRLVGDRALFNPELVRASDLAHPDPSAKIPINATSLPDNDLSSAYYPIPFNAQGMETLLQDAMLINSWQDTLTGINGPGRGQFQRGNKTLGEFNTVMGNSDNRARLTALVIDRRGLTPIKETMKLNIYMYGEDTTVIAPRTNKLIEVAIQDLIASGLQFEMADGYTPKSKMANTEVLLAMINLISTSPPLQQAYGTQLPAMVAHLASLSGLRGFDQYAAVAIKEWEKNMQVQQQLMQLMQGLQQQLGGGDVPPQA